MSEKARVEDVEFDRTHEGLGFSATDDGVKVRAAHPFDKFEMTLTREEAEELRDWLLDYLAEY